MRYFYMSGSLTNKGIITLKTRIINKMNNHREPEHIKCMRSFDKKIKFKFMIYVYFKKSLKIKLKKPNIE